MSRIVVDAMGGDHAPDEVVPGALQAVLARPDLQVILVGHEARMRALLQAQPQAAAAGDRLVLHHADQVVTMEDKPHEALTGKPDASIFVAARLVAAGQGDALVSAGNTGASVLACARNFKLIPGVRRAALAAVYPTEIRHGEKHDPFSLLLDVGRHAGCHRPGSGVVRPDGRGLRRPHLAQPAANGRAAVERIRGGQGAQGGGGRAPGAQRGFGQRPAPELHRQRRGRRHPRGSADVIVCSGYVGNVVLKMLEGVSDTVMRLARYAYKEKLVWRAALAMLSGGIKRLKAVTDWQEYGGAPLLGFDRLFIKAHGRSKARAMTNAVKVAHKAVASGLIDDIRTRMAAGAAASEAGAAAQKAPVT